MPTMTATDEFRAPPGLKGVIVADTGIGEVRGELGSYHYRHHDAPTLAGAASFEDVAALVLFGHEPGSAAAEALAVELGRARLDAATALRPLVEALLPAVDDPTVLLRLVLAGGFDRRPWLDLGVEERREVLVQAVAAVPWVVGAAHRRDPSIRPDPGASHAEDTVRLLTGNAPSPTAATAVERYLNLTVDHGFNASTFTGRVVTSTGADLGGVLASAASALSGPLHGGAPGRVLDMLDEIGAPDRSEAWVHDRLAAGDKIMGFGHAVYRAGDPRTALLRETAEAWGGPLVERAVDIEGRILATLADWKPEATIVTNVEYYAAVVLHLAGIPQDLFTAVFTTSRIVGWSAHVLEQTMANKIIRPKAHYVGELPPTLLDR